MNEVRHRDIIDLSVPRYISQAAAWVDLRAVVLEETGVDLHRRNSFAIRTVPVPGTSMSAIMVGPRSAPDPQTLAENTFVSLFGELTPAFAEAAREIEWQGGEASFVQRVAGGSRRAAAVPVMPMRLN